MLAEDDLSLTARSFAVTLTIDVSGDVRRRDPAARRRRRPVRGHRHGRVVPRRPAARGRTDRRRRRRPLVLLPRRPPAQRPGQPHRRARGRPEARSAHRRPLELSLGTSGGGLAAGLGVAATLDARPGRALRRRESACARRSSPGRETSVRPTSPSGPPRRTGSAWSSTPGWSPVAVSSSGTPAATTSARSSCSSGRSASRRSGCCPPDSDWSMLLLLYAQIPPVQIGFGFTLEGLGGLLGVHRAVDVTQLVTGMRTGAFDDLLFPADPVGDATRIIATLRQLFPHAPQHPDRRPDGRRALGQAGDHHGAAGRAAPARQRARRRPAGAVQGRRRRAAARRRRADRGGPRRPGARC